MERKVLSEEELLGGALFSPENPLEGIDEEMVLADDEMGGGGEVGDEVGGEEENEKVGETEKSEKERSENERSEKSEEEKRVERMAMPPPPAPPLPAIKPPIEEKVEKVLRTSVFPEPTTPQGLTNSQLRNRRRKENQEKWSPGPSQKGNWRFQNGGGGRGVAKSNTPVSSQQGNMKFPNGGGRGVALSNTPTSYGKRKERTPTGVTPPQSHKRPGNLKEGYAAFGHNSRNLAADTRQAQPDTQPDKRHARPDTQPDMQPDKRHARPDTQPDKHARPGSSRQSGVADRRTHPNRGGVLSRGGKPVKDRPTYVEAVATPIQVAYAKSHKLIREAEFQRFRRSLEEQVLLHLLQNPGTLNFGKTCLKEDGRIVVPCFDEATEAFVLDTVPKILGGEFGAWTFQNMPKGLARKAYSGFLVDFDPEIHDKEDLLKHLLISNRKELEVDSWEVIHITPSERRGEKGSYIWLSIPDVCLPELHKVDMRPKYLLRRMTRLEVGHRSQPYMGAGGGPGGKSSTVTRDG